MASTVAEAYFDLYPINATATCYYDRDEPTEHVATEDGIRDLSKNLALAVLVSIGVGATICMGVGATVLDRFYDT